MTHSLMFLRLFLCAALISGSAAFLRDQEARAAAAKINWPEHFTKTCEKSEKNQHMSEAELKSHCYYYKKPTSTYAAKAIPTSAQPCVKTLIKNAARQCPVK